MSKEELERLNIIELAVMCSNAAESLDGTAAEKGRNLKSEWVQLVARETPHAADFKARTDSGRQGRTEEAHGGIPIRGCLATI